MVGNSRSTVCAPSRPSASPWVSTSRAAAVRAAATLTCCPSTVSTAISAPSSVPGTRSPGSASTSGASSGVLGQRGVDGDRVAVGVEQPAGALGGGREVAGVGQREGARHVARRPVAELDPHDTGTVREPDGAFVPARAGRLDPAHRMHREEVVQVVGGERLTDGDAGADGAGGAPWRRLVAPVRSRVGLAS